MNIEKIEKIIQDVLNYASPIKPVTMEDMQSYVENSSDGGQVHMFEFEGTLNENTTIRFEFYTVEERGKVPCTMYFTIYDDRSVDEKYNFSIDIDDMLDEREMHNKLRDIADEVEETIAGEYSE